MRVYVLLVALTSMWGCSTRTESSPEVVDSVDTDTVQIIDDLIEDETIADADQYQTLQLAITELTNQQKSKAGDGYQLSLNASGYEYLTESTWYFDSQFSLSGCTQTWASEGMEGNSDYFFKLDKLMAYRDAQGDGSRNDVALYHKQLGGLWVAEADGTPIDSTLRAADPNSIQQVETDILKQLREIIGILREKRDEISANEEGLALRVEHEVNYGEETITETSEITLDQKLLDKLLE